MNNQSNKEVQVERTTAESDEWLTLAEMRRFLKLSRTKCWELVASGEIRAVRIGRSVRVSRRSLDEYLERHAYTEAK